MSSAAQPSMIVHAARFADLDPFVLYRILQLRSEVFVVEQDCVFLDQDGRDQAPTVRHIWVERDRQIVGVCRLLDEGTHREIGRIATAASARSAGIATKMIDYCFATSDGPWHIAAQAHLADWYAGLGFVGAGDRYLDDGIWHVAMVRPEIVT